MATDFFSGGFFSGGFFSGDTPPPTPSSGGGGGGGPTVNWQRTVKRRKRQTDELFASIEKSLREQMYGVPEEVQPQAIAPVRAPAIDTSQGIESALRELTRVASGYTDLSVRVATIRKEIAEHERREREAREAENDDDEFVMMD